MGYVVEAFEARKFISSAFTPMRDAIISMKLPVPPAQIVFIRCSGTPVTYTSFVSSPPISKITSASGTCLRTARRNATTS